MTYHYPNQQQPGNLWYHDHAMGLTRVNLLAGLLGSYIIHDHPIEDPLGLPCDEFDRPLIVFDRNFLIDGSIYLNSTGNNPSIHPQWQPEYFGDVIMVNGSLLPASVISVYCAYVCYTGLSSEPRDYECNALSKSRAVSISNLVLGMLTTVLSVL